MRGALVRSRATTMLRRSVATETVVERARQEPEVSSTTSFSCRAVPVTFMVIFPAPTVPGVTVPMVRASAPQGECMQENFAATGTGDVVGLDGMPIRRTVGRDTGYRSSSVGGTSHS
ncbi:hypothetical protein DEJ46_16695 [Streptomyces venezuelae]|uniref:Uncharacterized protein n=1 Tax=Streptomyces venezuelae TaxID=54571 RepID=A0A5P2ARV4_STRVZ|nr:hypothetical protein DEJ46_16695 [Streptomyces venezuelae]